LTFNHAFAYNPDRSVVYAYATSSVIWLYKETRLL